MAVSLKLPWSLWSLQLSLCGSFKPPLCPNLLKVSRGLSMQCNSRPHLSRSKGRPLGVRKRLEMFVSALRPSVGCPETPLSSRVAACLPKPAGGVLSPEAEGFKLSPILPFASREAQCGTSLGRCSDTTRLLPGAGMGSSQAVDHSVLPDTAWLQWELVTPQLRWAPLLGLGSVCSHLQPPSPCWCLAWKGKQKLFSWTLLRVSENQENPKS